MGGFETTTTSTIPAPITDVFGLLSDPERMAGWLPGCRSVTARVPWRKGARFRVAFGDGRATEFEIVDFNPPTTLGWVERGARAGWKTFVQLQFAGGSTTITFHEAWAPQTLIAWLRGKLRAERRATREFFEAAIQNLRKLLVR